MNLTIPKPEEVGVFLCLEDDSNECMEKFGFESETEVVDYIKDHISSKGIFIVYTYKKSGGKDIFAPIVFGDKEDL